MQRRVSRKLRWVFAVVITWTVALTIVASLGNVATPTSVLAASLVDGSAKHPSGSGSRPKLYTGVSLFYGFDAHGNPSVLSNMAGYASHPHQTRWALCSTAQQSCQAETVGGLKLEWAAQEINPGPIPDGDYLTATARVKGHTYVARTPTWLGRVVSTGSPRISGTARVGALVHPVAGRWTGGWSGKNPAGQPTGALEGGPGPDQDELSIEACRTSAGQHCTNLSPQGTRFCLYSPIAIKVPGQFAGDYLFAFDEREPYDTVCAEPGFPNPAGEPVVKPGPIATRSAPSGPVQA